MADVDLNVLAIFQQFWRRKAKSFAESAGKVGGVRKASLVSGGGKIGPLPCGLDADDDALPRDVAAQRQASDLFEQVQKAAL